MFKKNSLDSIILYEFGLTYQIKNNILEKLIQETYETILNMTQKII